MALKAEGIPLWSYLFVVEYAASRATFLECSTVDLIREASPANIGYLKTQVSYSGCLSVCLMFVMSTMLQ